MMVLDSCSSHLAAARYAQLNLQELLSFLLRSPNPYPSVTQQTHPALPQATSLCNFKHLFPQAQVLQQAQFAGAVTSCTGGSITPGIWSPWFLPC